MATPIGNLGDLTFRAVETLKSVDVVAAEDTQHTLRLLNHLQLKKHLISCRAQNEEKGAEQVIACLKNGEDVAFVSDAGTPSVSDPGAVLVDKVRAAGFPVAPIPGVSAATAIWSVAGECGKSVLFEGFLSPSAGKRRRRLQELEKTGFAVILFESPFRIVKLLADIADIYLEREIVIGRELTKIHEEVLKGTGKQLRDFFAAKEKIQGEFVVLICGKKLMKRAENADKQLLGF